MRKRDYILGLIVMVGFGFAFLWMTPQSAQALVNVPPLDEWYVPANDPTLVPNIGQLASDYFGNGASASTLGGIDASEGSWLTFPEAWINPVSGAVSTGSEIDAGMGLFGGALGLTAASLLVVGAGAGYVGYRYVGPYLGKTLYRLSHSDDSLNSAGALSGHGEWWVELTGSGSSSQTGFPTIGGTTGIYANPIYKIQDGKVGVAGYPSPHSVGTAGTPNQTSTVQDTWCVPGANFHVCTGNFTGSDTSAFGSESTAMYQWATTGGGQGTATMVVNTGSNGVNCTVAGECFNLVRQPAQQNTRTIDTPTDPTTYGGLPTPNQLTPTYTAPTTPPTELQITVALQQLHSIAASSGDAKLAAAAQAAIEAIGAVATKGAYQGPGNPLPTGSSQFTIPEPDYGVDTSSTYRQKLRDMGYLGKVVVLDDTDFLSNPDGSPASGFPETYTGITAPWICTVPCMAGVMATPGTVTRISVGNAVSSSSWRMYDHLTGDWAPWPDTPLSIKKTTTVVTIQRVPFDYVAPKNPDGTTTQPPPNDGGGGGGGTSGCKLPTIPSLDLTPLTGLNFGSKFPFGVFGVVTNAISYFNVTPVTPEFKIDFTWARDLLTMGGTVAPVGSTADWTYDVKLDAFDSYMTTIRAIISIALWIGAVWFLGITLLGFRGAGDLSEAADAGIE